MDIEKDSAIKTASGAAMSKMSKRLIERESGPSNGNHANLSLKTSLRPTKNALVQPYIPHGHRLENAALRSKENHTILAAPCLDKPWGIDMFIIINKIISFTISILIFFNNNCC